MNYFGWPFTAFIISLTSISIRSSNAILLTCNPPKVVCAVSGNYTSVPNSLITNVTEYAYIYTNKITSINSLVDFLNSNVSYLDLTNNLLTTFPYLPNIQLKLTTLVLKTNRISFINTAYLQILTNLIVLRLEQNYLTSFPDVNLPSLMELYLGNNRLTELPWLPLLGQTVTYLGLFNNSLQSINPSTLLLYKNLASLNLPSTGITTLPNFCTLPTATLTTNITLTLTSNDFVCDCRLRWLRTLPSQVYVSGNCASPSSVAGLSLANLTASQLSCTGQTSKIFARVASNFYCSNPPIIVRYAVRDVTSCATKCLATTDCANFNLGLRNDVTSSSGDAEIYYCDVSGRGGGMTGLTSLGATNWQFYVSY